MRQAYDGGADSALLLAPMLGFPLPEGVLGRTIDETRAALGSGAFLVRYKGEDGLEGGEGEFLVCSSWLADAELARRAVTATFGWRGVVAAMAQSRQVGRIRSSTKSQLDWP